MKKIFYTIAIGFLVCTSLNSCTKEDLDIKNPNTITEAQFWVSEGDAEKGLNAAYAMFYKPGLWARWIYFRLDLTSDEGYSVSPWAELADWTRFNYVNYNFFEGNVVTFRDTYKAVFRCNQVLDKVPNIPFADPNKQKSILAQAKFLRALHYYYAALLWENIPIVLASSKPDDQPARSTLNEVWAQVEKDLIEAEMDLPVVWDAPNLGRPTKGAARGYLARTYMQQHKWGDAKNALDYFFTGLGKDKYSLISQYRHNFTHEQENNTESVFEIQFSDLNKTEQYDDGQNANMVNNRPQFFAPRGLGWSDGQARFWLINAFKEEPTLSGGIDERLRYTLFYPSLTADFGDKVYGRNWEWNNNEAWFKKYSRDYYRNNEDNWAQNNYRLIRYADILLMYAEVLNELNSTGSAAQYVDMVRNRANLAPLATAHPSVLLEKDLFRERIKKERVLELCGESVRWADLKRWGELETQAKVNQVKLRDPDFNNFVVGKHIRLPLPASEILNNPNLKDFQNPLY